MQVCCIKVCEEEEKRERTVKERKGEGCREKWIGSSKRRGTRRGWGVGVEKKNEGWRGDLLVLCCCTRPQTDVELCYECSRPMPRDGRLHDKPGGRI